jgi:hypothetical protein
MDKWQQDVTNVSIEYYFEYLVLLYLAFADEYIFKKFWAALMLSVPIPAPAPDRSVRG